MHEFNCFITSNNYIECIYIDNDSTFHVAVYDRYLKYLNKILLDSDLFSFDYDISNFNSIKAIHLKNEIGVFCYYFINNDGIYSQLRIQINELYFEEGIPSFKSIIQGETKIIVSFDDSNYNLNGKRFNMESLIKLNDNKFSYAYIYSENIIILIIFDLYGDNDDNLFIRYYPIDFSSYIYKINEILKLFNYNSLLGMGFNYCENNHCRSYSKALFIIFGYSKQTNNEITLDIYKLNQGFLFEINNFISIDNNLFGYEINVKITTVSNKLAGIKFFSINKNREINKNELIDKEDIILFDFSGINVQIGENYMIEITWEITTPEDEKLSDYYNKSESYGGEEFCDFYKSTIIEERILTIELKFGCSESITSSCSYPGLATKTIQNDVNDIIFLYNFTYTNEDNK